MLFNTVSISDHFILGYSDLILFNNTFIFGSVVYIYILLNTFELASIIALLPISIKRSALFVIFSFSMLETSKVY